MEKENYEENSGQGQKLEIREPCSPTRNAYVYLFKCPNGEGDIKYIET